MTYRIATTLIGLGCLVAAAGSAQAETRTFDAACSVASLKSAIADSNAYVTGSGFGPDDRSIIKLAKECTYTLTAPHGSGRNGLEPIIAPLGALQIDGNGATIERSDGADTLPFRLVEIKIGFIPPDWNYDNGRPDITITDLTLRNGLAENSGPESGGGLLFAESLAHYQYQARLDQVTLQGNRAGLGGGLAAKGFRGVGRTDQIYITVQNSVIKGNRALLQGGGILADHVNLQVSNSVITENMQRSVDPLNQLELVVSGAGGGGIGCFGCDGLQIDHSQISHNRSWGLGGGGIAVLDLTPEGQDLGAISNSSVFGNDVHVPDVESLPFEIDFEVEYGSGGGLAMGALGPQATEPVSLQIQASVFYDNSAATSAGGIGVAGRARVAIENTTISGNQAGERAGGVGVAGDLVELTHVTITDNTAPRDAGIGIGLYHDLFSEELTVGNAAFVNSVIAGNHNATDCYLDGGTISNNVGSMLGTDAAGAHACNGANGYSFALLGSSPQLAALANQGGSTPVHLPLAGSPLLGAADSAGCAAFDQRGAARDPLVCDMGAVQVSGSATPGSVIFADRFERP